MNGSPKTVIVDSRNDSTHYGLSGIGRPGKPQFKIKCPHCGTVQLLTLERDVSVLGLQWSPLVVCDKEFVEETGIGHLVKKGCNKRYVVDVRVDVLATCIPLVED